MVQNLEKAILLEDVYASSKPELLNELHALDPTERKYQGLVRHVLCKYLMPFSWAEFLKRRISLTYHISLASYNQEALLTVFEALVCRLEQSRLVLVLAFLRFALNS